MAKYDTTEICIIDIIISVTAAVGVNVINVAGKEGVVQGGIGQEMGEIRGKDTCSGSSIVV